MKKTKIILPGDSEISVERLQEILESQGYSLKLNENKMNSFEEFLLFEYQRILTFDKFLNERVKWDGKYLHFDGSTTSIPGSTEESAIILQGDDTFKVYKGSDGLYAQGDSYDKTFKDELELVKWINDEKLEYIGIDDRN